MYVCMYVCMCVDETKQLTEEIRRHLMDPEWTAEASAAPGEVTNKAHCCGTAAMYVELAVGSHWRQEKWSRTPSTNTLQLKTATC